MKNNLGYSLGRYVRRLVSLFSRLEAKMQQRGVPRWITKLPVLFFIIIFAGLLLAGAIFIAVFVALMLVLAWGLLAISKGNPELEEEFEECSCSGYCVGPEGPGMYENGQLVRNMTEDEY